MCGIAGLIHRGTSGDIGREMTAMLQALKHRGPDSAGFALYGKPDPDHHIMRFKVAEQEDLRTGFRIHHEIRERKALVDERLAEMGAKVEHEDQATEYAYRYVFTYAGDLRRLADYIEDIEGAEILSLGHALELIKDLGDATRVSGQYALGGFKGTHGIGHTRMATESDVDIRSAHPYWAYPFSDVALVHNGQLTNYWTFRRELERRGHRFMTNCDSELIAVYVADRIALGVVAPWRVLLLIVDGQIPFGITTLLCMLAGALIASIAIARSQGREERPLEPADVRTRGPITYAGPGSLGGTESVLPRR